MRSRLVPAIAVFIGVGVSALSAGQRMTPDAGRAAVNELVALLKLPNVATNQDDIRQNAEYLKQAFERRGFRTEVVTTSKSPVVLAELRGQNPGRIITFYAHYDGQPVIPAEWTDSAPFEPVFRNGSLEKGAKIVQLPASGPLDRSWRIYARSAADDKGAIAAILAGIDAVRASNATPTSTIRIVLEGDEEAGSPVLEQVLTSHSKPPAGTAALQTGGDLIIMMDGPRHPTGRPTFFFGARGITSVELEVFGAQRDLHSGNYGNWAPNPALELARLLASMKDAGGKVTIAGFYDDVVPLTAEEKRAIAEIPDASADQMRAFGFARPERVGVRLEELHNLPTLNISGLGAGTVAGQGRTVIPANAIARMDLRVVKAVDPAKQVARLRAHIEAMGYHVIAGDEPTDQERATFPRLARLVQLEGYPAGRTAIDQPMAASVVAAITAASSSGPAIRYPTLGGSAPFYIFTDRLGVPTIGMPIANYDNNQHGPNENLELGAFFDGIEAVRAILTMR